MLGDPHLYSEAVDADSLLQQSVAVLRVLQLDEAKFVLPSLSGLGDNFQPEPFHTSLTPDLLLQFFLRYFWADAADVDVAALTCLIQCFFVSLVSLPGLVPFVVPLSVVVAVVAAVVAMILTSASPEVLFVELFERVGGIFVDDFELVGILLLDYLFEAVEVIPKDVEFELALLFGQVEYLYALEDFLEMGRASLSGMSQVGDISFLVGDRGGSLGDLAQFVFQEVQDGIFGLHLLQYLLEQQLVEGIVFGLLALGNLADELLGLLLPQRDVEVVSDQLYLDVGFLLNFQQILDVGLVEEGNIGAFLACPACPAGAVDVGLWVLGGR